MFSISAFCFCRGLVKLFLSDCRPLVKTVSQYVCSLFVRLGPVDTVDRSNRFITAYDWSNCCRPRQLIGQTGFCLLLLIGQTVFRHRVPPRTIFPYFMSYWYFSPLSANIKQEIKVKQQITLFVNINQTDTFVCKLSITTKPL